MANIARCDCADEPTAAARNADAYLKLTHEWAAACKGWQEEHDRLTAQLEGAVDALREFAEWVRDYRYSQPAHRQRAQAILDALDSPGER